MKPSVQKITRRGAVGALAILGALFPQLRALGEAEMANPPHQAKARESSPKGDGGALWLTLPPTLKLPTATRAGHAIVNGTEIFFGQFGREGVPLLLLHGGLANSNYWGHQIERIAGDFAVTVMETRGHRRSPVTSNNFSYAVFAEDVVGLMNELRIPSAGIVGWSDGAVTGLQLAITHPERVTKLFAFGSAPFPYDGAVPGGRAFLDVKDGGQRGHRSYTGKVLWENETFGDSRVLVHVPESFDPAKPSVMVVFFHGFGATLSRDVLRRQKVPAQVTASGANAVLVAPQFAVDARDGSAGRFWQHGGFSRFLDEAAHHLAVLRGDPESEAVFQKMPIVMVAYSGGFAPAAFCLRDIASTNRVRGVVLLDAAYGELETYALWAAREHKSGGFFVSSYTLSTKGHNNDLKHMLAAKGVPFSNDESKVGRGVTFFDTGADYTHESYVTQAWVEFPIKDVLARIPGVGPGDANVASQSVTLRDRTAARE
ncbi:MAG: alpha/beta hydrolase [Methylocystis sp.]